MYQPAHTAAIQLGIGSDVEQPVSQLVSVYFFVILFFELAFRVFSFA